MKAGVIPYNKKNDLVPIGSTDKKPRPAWPTYVEDNVIADDLQLVRTQDVPLNKRNFIYRPCLPNPLFVELGYACTDYPFSNIAGFNINDRANKICLPPERNDIVAVAPGLGWRTARTDVCIKEGLTYWEVRVIAGGIPESLPDADSGAAARQLLDRTPHLRLGVSRREANLEAPVGYDSYGYGIRDYALESVHEGRLKHVLDHETSTLRPGDTLGFLLVLPSLEEQISQAREYTQRKLDALAHHSASSSNTTQNSYNENDAPRKKQRLFGQLDFQRALLEQIDYGDVVRDNIAIRYKNQLFFESTDYVRTTRPEYYSMDKRAQHEFYQLKESALHIFVNGEHRGAAFSGLQPFLPPFSELQYNEKLYYNYWRLGPEIPREQADAHVSATSSTISGSAVGGLSSHTNVVSKGHLLRNKFANNSRLGYYPTVSCFNGGSAQILTRENDLLYLRKAREFSKSLVRDTNILTLEDLMSNQIADEVVWDIIDEVTEEAAAGRL